MVERDKIRGKCSDGEVIEGLTRPDGVGDFRLLIHFRRDFSSLNEEDGEIKAFF